MRLKEKVILITGAAGGIENRPPPSVAAGTKIVAVWTSSARRLR